MPSKLYLSILFILSFFYLSTTIVYSQGDTVFIFEKPLVIKKKVYVTKELPKIKRYNTTYYSAQFGYSINRDYYGVCATPYCYDYYTQVRASTKPQYNSIFSFGVGYITKKFALETSLYYSIYRDQFTYKDNNRSTVQESNKYHSFDISIQPGYFLATKKSKFYLLLKAGPSLSYLTNVTGVIYSKFIPTAVGELNKELTFNKFSYRFGIDMIIGEKKYNTLSLQAGLFYAYDLRSIIHKSDFFTRQRNVFGIKVGLSYLKNKLYK